MFRADAIRPDEGDILRPLIVPGGAHTLAGGWLRFDTVEVLNGGQRYLVDPSQIDTDSLERMTAPRASMAGLDMSRPNIMGILNVTPDSFSDGGRFVDPAVAFDQAMEMVAAGAHILDIGGESTRPGADEVSIDEELSRTVPVIAAIRAQSDIPISIDTRKAAVGRAAVEAGATMINDVSAFEFDHALAQVTAQTGVPVCLMHSQGLPKSMQDNPVYDDVVADVMEALDRRKDFAFSQGVSSDAYMIDPGIGFGKTIDHNLALLRNLARFHTFGCPILVGASRKRFIGTLTGQDVAADRLAGSVAVALAAVAQGAQILRVHDVRATADALAVWQAVT